MVISADSIDETEYFYVVGGANLWVTFWNSQQTYQRFKQYPAIAVVRNFKSGDMLGESHPQFLYLETFTDTELKTATISASGDYEAILIAFDANKPNLFHTGHFSNLYCPEGQEKFFKFNLNKFDCGPATSYSKYCLTGEHFMDGGCLKCMETFEGKEIERVLAPTPYRISRYVCKEKQKECKPPSGNFLNSDDSCFNCQARHPNCQTCFDFAGGPCAKCQKGFALNLANNGCIDCNATLRGCGACFQNPSFKNRVECRQCSAGYYRNPYPSNWGCIQCPRGCLTCENDKKCTECAPYFRLETMEDFSEVCVGCKINEFFDGQKCQLCTSLAKNKHCLECEHITAKCTKCPNFYFELTEASECELTCPQSQYKSPKNGENGVYCENCPVNCRECKDYDGTCERCFVGYVAIEYNGKPACVKECTPEYQYVNNPGDRLCRSCSDRYSPGGENCIRCEPLGGRCLQCRKPYSYMLKSTRSCATSCLGSNFLKQVEKGLYECTPCSTIKGFEQCSFCEHETGICNGCKNGYQLNLKRTKCRADCADDEYYDEDLDSCMNCDNLMRYCTKCFSNGFCNTCKKGYNKIRLLNGTEICQIHCGYGNIPPKYIDEEGDFGNGVCKLCRDVDPSGGKCISCAKNTGKCTICDSKYFLRQPDGYCQMKCSQEFDQYWTGELENSCAGCSVNKPFCKRCTNETGRCEVCEDGYWMTPENNCQRICFQGGLLNGENRPSQFWDEASNWCRDCPQNCLKCANVTGECQKCKSTKWLSSTGVCQTSCKPEGQYLSFGEDKCYECPPNCRKCLNDTGQCQGCINGFWLDRNRDCQVSCLDEGQYWRSASAGCQECQDNCKKCANVTGVCQDCSLGYSYSLQLKRCVLEEDEDKDDEEKPVEVKKVKLVTQYYDKLDVAVVMVFDGPVTPATLPEGLEVLEVYLRTSDQEKGAEKVETRLDVLRIELDASKRRQIHRIYFSEDELNSAELALKRGTSTKKQEKGDPEGRKRQTRSTTSQEPDNGAHRLLWSEKTHQKMLIFDEKLTKKSPKTRMVQETSGQYSGGYGQLEGAKRSGEAEEGIDEYLAIIKRVNFFRSSSTPILKDVGFWVMVLGSVVGIMVLIRFVPFFEMIIEVFQLVYLLGVVGEDLPTNLVGLTSEFGRGIFNPIPITIVPPEAISCRQMDPIFYRAGLDCVALNSPVFWFLIILVLLIIIKSSLAVLVSLISKGKSKNGKKSINLEELKIKEKASLDDREQRVMRFMKMRD